MSYFEEIYSFEQLHSLIKSGVITKSFWVNSTNVNMLNGVKEIRIGNNGTVHFKNLVDLVDLEYVDCSFSFWGNMISLKKLKAGFKEIYGDTVFNFLFDYKMEFARKLLDTGSYNVNEVGLKIGYSTSSHFIAAFKKKFGTTPKKYLLNLNVNL